MAHIPRRYLAAPILAAVLACLALSAPATPAVAHEGHTDGGYTLHLTAESQAVVGKPMIIRATGTIPPPGDIPIPYWFSLDAIPTTVTSTCPQDRWQGVQFAEASGGTVVVLTQREVPDAAGNFTIPVAVTPRGAGSVLLCGYTDDGLTNTLASASLVLDIAAASPTGGDPRSNRPIPVEVARGIRMCRALLAPAKFKGCVRDLVKDARAACRKELRSRRGRARCLRQVRRVSRKYVSVTTRGEGR
jgi:hypothetical protein